MLLQSLEHFAYRIGGLAAVIYAAEKTNILRQVISPNENGVTLAMKTSAFLSASEYVSDQALSRLFGSKPPALTNTITEFGYAFVSNSVVLYAMDKMNLDEMIVKPGSSDEMHALELGVLFVLVQEITHKLFQMWGLHY